MIVKYFSNYSVPLNKNNLNSFFSTLLSYLDAFLITPVFHLIPFNNIILKIKEENSVRLSVFNLKLIQTAVLVNVTLKPGSYRVGFNAGSLKSGVYLYQLKTDNFSKTKKLIILK